MVKKEQNAIVIYFDEGQERELVSTAKAIGLNKSSFCRMAALRRLREEQDLLKINLEESS